MVARSVRPFSPNGNMHVTMKNIAAPARNVPHGLMNAPTVRLAVNNSGYEKPVNQLAKNNLKLRMTPPQSLPVHKFEKPSTFKFTKGRVTDFSKLKCSSVDNKLAGLL